jgi:hypothetical protein
MPQAPSFVGIFGKLPYIGCVGMRAWAAGFAGSNLPI